MRMIPRKIYMDKLLKVKDLKVIKVVSGIRRCGKSTLLRMFSEHLRESGVEAERIVSINFENADSEPMLDYHVLHNYIETRLNVNKMTYVILDEIQNVPMFQKAINSLFLRDNIDIYMTGSNAWLMSGELATLLSGRYIEISMLPLSFSEYMQAANCDRRDAFRRYFKFGGFPYAAGIDDDEVVLDYMRGIYNTVLLKDVIERNKISDAVLLESIIKFLLDSVGNLVSSKKIADSLTSAGRRTSSVSVENYIEALRKAFVFYRVGRYDVRGRQYLKSLDKYYAADTGFRRLLLGERNADIGHMLENIVYLELIRRGYEVSVGKSGDREIDFVAKSPSELVYYQVAASVADSATLDRELASLKKLPDNYAKAILTMDELTSDHDGIKVINLIDFLLGKD